MYELLRQDEDDKTQIDIYEPGCKQFVKSHI